MKKTQPSIRTPLIQNQIKKQSQVKKKHPKF